MSTKKSDNIKVAVRCRPMSKKETAANWETIVQTNHSASTVELIPVDGDHRVIPDREPRTFNYDACYGPNTAQDMIFNEMVQPLVDAALDGFNSTIFAYGQSGSGKTFTMTGGASSYDTQDPEILKLRGMIPLSFEHIFNRISAENSDRRWLVEASYLEIYNEDLFDLLIPKRNCPGGKRPPLPLRENKDREVFVQDLSWHTVANEHDITQLMENGMASRSVASTGLNDVSSRSHAIFAVRIECAMTRPDGTQHITVGKLNLVDLAGSESCKKTGATGQQLVEGAKINQSLSCLLSVISKLVDGESHIPYRDSKLTRLLQNSLGGNAKTLMIAAVSPASYNHAETWSTLRYADQAKRIKNAPKRNEDPKDAKLREMQEEIDRLKAALAAAATGQGDAAKVGDMLAIAEARVAAAENAGAAGTLSASQQRELEEAAAARDRLQTELAEREAAAAAAVATAAALQDRLSSMQGTVLTAQKLKNKARERGEKLRKAREVMLSQQARQTELERDLATKNALLEGKSAALAEAAARAEAQGKSLDELKGLLKRVHARWKTAEADADDLVRAANAERDEAVSSVSALVREVQRRQFLLEMFVPREMLVAIESQCYWSDEHETWALANTELTGNAVEARELGLGGGAGVSAAALDLEFARLRDELQIEYSGALPAMVFEPPQATLQTRPIPPEYEPYV